MYPLKMGFSNSLTAVTLRDSKSTVSNSWYAALAAWTSIFGVDSCLATALAPIEGSLVLRCTSIRFMSFSLCRERRLVYAKVRLRMQNVAFHLPAVGGTAIVNVPKIWKTLNLL
jgi:hypothetical protein